MNFVPAEAKWLLWITVTEVNQRISSCPPITSLFKLSFSLDSYLTLVSCQHTLHSVKRRCPKHIFTVQFHTITLCFMPILINDFRLLGFQRWFIKSKMVFLSSKFWKSLIMSQWVYFRLWYLKKISVSFSYSLTHHYLGEKGSESVSGSPHSSHWDYWCCCSADSHMKGIEGDCRSCDSHCQEPWHPSTLTIPRNMSRLHLILTNIHILRIMSTM